MKNLLTTTSNNTLSDAVAALPDQLACYFLDWTVEFDGKLHFGVGRFLLVDVGEIAGHGTDIELIFCCVIHQGFLTLDATHIVVTELGGIPSPLVDLTCHISVPTLTLQFAALIPRVRL